MSSQRVIFSPHSSIGSIVCTKPSRFLWAYFSLIFSIPYTSKSLKFCFQNSFDSCPFQDFLKIPIAKYIYKLNIPVFGKLTLTNLVLLAWKAFLNECYYFLRRTRPRAGAASGDRTVSQHDHETNSFATIVETIVWPGQLKHGHIL